MGHICTVTVFCLREAALIAFLHTAYTLPTLPQQPHNYPELGHISNGGAENFAAHKELFEQYYEPLFENDHGHLNDGDGSAESNTKKHSPEHGSPLEWIEQHIGHKGPHEAHEAHEADEADDAQKAHHGPPPWVPEMMHSFFKSAFEEHQTASGFPPVPTASESGSTPSASAHPQTVKAMVSPSTISEHPKFVTAIEASEASSSTLSTKSKKKSSKSAGNPKLTPSTVTKTVSVSKSGTPSEETSFSAELGTATELRQSTVTKKGPTTTTRTTKTVKKVKTVEAVPFSASETETTTPVTTVTDLTRQTSTTTTYTTITPSASAPNVSRTFAKLSARLATSPPFLALLPTNATGIVAELPEDQKGVKWKAKLLTSGSSGSGNSSHIWHPLPTVTVFLDAEGDLVEYGRKNHGNGSLSTTLATSPSQTALVDAEGDPVEYYQVGELGLGFNLSSPSQVWRPLPTVTVTLEVDRGSLMTSKDDFSGFKGLNSSLFSNASTTASRRIHGGVGNHSSVPQHTLKSKQRHRTGQVSSLGFSMKPSVIPTISPTAGLNSTTTGNHSTLTNGPLDHDPRSHSLPLFTAKPTTVVNDRGGRYPDVYPTLEPGFYGGVFPLAMFQSRPTQLSITGWSPSPTQTSNSGNGVSEDSRRKAEAHPFPTFSIPDSLSNDEKGYYESSHGHVSSRNKNKSHSQDQPALHEKLQGPKDSAIFAPALEGDSYHGKQTDDHGSMVNQDISDESHDASDSTNSEIHDEAPAANLGRGASEHDSTGQGQYRASKHSRISKVVHEAFKAIFGGGNPPIATVFPLTTGKDIGKEPQGGRIYPPTLHSIPDELPAAIVPSHDEANDIGETQNDLHSFLQSYHQILKEFLGTLSAKDDGVSPTLTSNHKDSRNFSALQELSQRPEHGAPKFLYLFEELFNKSSAKSTEREENTTLLQPSHKQDEDHGGTNSLDHPYMSEELVNDLIRTIQSLCDYFVVHHEDWAQLKDEVLHAHGTGKGEKEAEVTGGPTETQKGKATQTRTDDEISPSQSVPTESTAAGTPCETETVTPTPSSSVNIMKGSMAYCISVAVIAIALGML